MIIEGICLAIYCGAVYCVFSRCLPKDASELSNLKVQLQFHPTMTLAEYEFQRKQISTNVTYASLTDVLHSEFAISSKDQQMLLTHLCQLQDDSRLHYDVYPEEDLLRVNIYNLQFGQVSPVLQPQPSPTEKNKEKEEEEGEEDDIADWENVV